MTVSQTGKNRTILTQFQEFMHQEAAGAIVLLAATVAAVAIANSPFREAYDQLLHAEMGFVIGDGGLVQSFQHWVDDALMALFFLVVGLEIKREFIVGELSTLRGALLPVAAALGGMLIPAAFYFALNRTGPEADGWGVPMATDIAFALGVLAVLGPRVPAALKVFLAALAIADDIGAILVIAIFYTDEIAIGWLLSALVPLGVLVLMNRRHIEEPIAYLIGGSALWFCFLSSGIHATVAGVIAAMTIPAVARIQPTEFTNICRIKLDEIEEIDIPGAHTLEDDRQQDSALMIQRAAVSSVAPLQRLERALHPITTFVVLPLFALANAGIEIGGAAGDLVTPVTLGIFGGLVLGKPIGVLLASWIVVRLGFADLPRGVGWRHITGAGMLAGIGFTMSLFIANLAFGEGVNAAEPKAAIFVASIVAGVAGALVLRFWAPSSSSAQAARP